MFGFQVRQHLAQDGGEVVLRPVQAKAEVAAGERAFHHHEVRQAVEAGVLAQEHRQRAW
jgi:hypothetical protein